MSGTMAEAIEQATHSAAMNPRALARAIHNATEALRSQCFVAMQVVKPDGSMRELHAAREQFRGQMRGLLLLLELVEARTQNVLDELRAHCRFLRGERAMRSKR